MGAKCPPEPPRRCATHEMFLLAIVLVSANQQGASFRRSSVIRVDGGRTRFTFGRRPSMLSAGSGECARDTACFDDQFRCAGCRQQCDGLLTTDGRPVAELLTYALLLQTVAQLGQTRRESRAGSTSSQTYACEPQHDRICRWESH